jgi:hypothetical protein
VGPICHSNKTILQSLERLATTAIMPASPRPCLAAMLPPCHVRHAHTPSDEGRGLSGGHLFHVEQRRPNLVVVGAHRSHPNWLSIAPPSVPKHRSLDECNNRWM